jgi:type I restriction enzyme S subunit
MKLVKRRLGDIAQIIGGATPSTKIPEYWDGGIPWITPKDLSGFEGIFIREGSRNISKVGMEHSSVRILPAGTVLYTSRAPIGYVAIASAPVTTNQGFKSLVLNDGYVPEFVYYLLKHSKAEIESFSSGGTFAEISAKALAEVELEIPDERHQHAVADILFNLDSKILLNKKISKSLESIAQSIFKSWFIDFDPVKAKMAGEKPVGMDDATAALFPDSMEYSELGLIPQSWKCKSAGDLFAVGIGRTPPRKESEWFCEAGSGIDWVSIRDMGTYGVFSNRTNEGLTRDAVEKFRIAVVPKGTVLMSFKLTVGKLCVTDREVVTNEAIAHFRELADSPVGSTFAYLWLANQNMANLDNTSSIGTATNSAVIKAIKFLVPSKQVHEAFAKVVRPIFEEIEKLTIQSRHLAAIRDSLLPRLISGELEIPEEMLGA